MKFARTPPYHSQLNPIEMIWALLKAKVRPANNKVGIIKIPNPAQLTKKTRETMINLIHKGFNEISLGEVRRTIEHVWREEDRILKMEREIDETQFQPEEEEELVELVVEMSDLERQMAIAGIEVHIERFDE